MPSVFSARAQSVASVLLCKVSYSQAKKGKKKKELQNVHSFLVAYVSALSSLNSNLQQLIGNFLLL